MTSWRRALTLSLVLVGALLSPGRASAHETAPGILLLEENGPGVVRFAWHPPPDPAIAPSLRVRFDPRCSVREDARGEDGGRRGTVSCPSGHERAQVSGLAAFRATTVVRVTRETGTEVLVLGSDADVASFGPGAEPRGAAGWVAWGFEHVVEGWDHVLFVLGLVLLLGAGRPLALALLSFTAAHAVTLGMRAGGVLAVPDGPVEIGIALSIVLLADEASRRDPDSALRRAPWIAAFAFGLVHGLGFAGALSEIGLPPGAELSALAAFHVGIELGQIVVVASALAFAAAMRALARRAPALRSERWRAAAIDAMGAIAMWATLDRALAWWASG